MKDNNDDDIQRQPNVLEQRFSTLYDRLSADDTHTILSRGAFMAANRYLYENQDYLAPIVDNIEIVEGLLNSIMDGLGLHSTILSKANEGDSTPRLQLRINEPKGGQVIKENHANKAAFVSIACDAYYAGDRNAQFIASKTGTEHVPCEDGCVNCYTINLLHNSQKRYVNPPLDDDEIKDMAAHILLDEEALTAYPIQLNNKESLDTTCDKLFNPGTDGE